ncbi:hypothetical protein SDC9_156288 [bioreactor metagenome]|uniref:Virulence protein SciE type n=1 Tax=bioreactor metagenome TaxID=1076179 RepID=A0A645F563_9ZZZZ
MAATLNAALVPMAQVYGQALAAEQTRDSVFAGERRAKLLGDDKPWVTQMADALQQTAQGQHDAAEDLRMTALEAAPPCAGRLNDVRFDWVADADSRLGPILEIFIHGEYHWVPFESVVEIKMAAPADRHDLVWIPAQVRLVNEGFAPALIPARYPLAADGDEKEHLLSRLTSWTALTDTEWRGHGVRVLTTDTAELSLLDVRHIRLDTLTANDE